MKTKTICVLLMVILYPIEATIAAFPKLQLTDIKNRYVQVCMDSYGDRSTKKITLNHGVFNRQAEHTLTDSPILLFKETPCNIKNNISAVWAVFLSTYMHRKNKIKNTSNFHYVTYFFCHNDRTYIYSQLYKTESGKNQKKKVHINDIIGIATLHDINADYTIFSIDNFHAENSNNRHYQDLKHKCRQLSLSHFKEQTLRIQTQDQPHPLEGISEIFSGNRFWVTFSCDKRVVVSSIPPPPKQYRTASLTGYDKIQRSLRDHPSPFSHSKIRRILENKERIELHKHWASSTDNKIFFQQQQLEERQKIEKSKGKSLLKNGSGLKIKKSSIPFAGKGLFATKPIKKNEYITFFEGDVHDITEDDHSAIHKYFEYLGTHVISIGKHRIINGRKKIQCGDYAATMANDCSFSKYVDKRYRRKIQANAKVVTHTTNALLVATKDIDIGAEIFFEYDTLYDQELCARQWEAGLFCEQCGKRFDDTHAGRFTLSSHQQKDGKCTRATLGGQHERAECTLCYRTYSSKKSLQKHVQTYHGSKKSKPVQKPTKKDYICPYCLETFSFLKTLYRHQRTVHSQNKEYKCSECTYETAYHWQFRDHIMTHSGEKHPCNKCTKKFNSPNLLKAHIRAVHTASKKGINLQLPCEYDGCNKTFASENSLRRHMKCIHEKKLCCDICGLPVVSQSALTRHKKSHTEEKTLQCKQCSATFKAEENLEQHILRVHNKLYPCPHCGKHEISKVTLKTHIARCHTKEGGIKTYTCTLCDYQCSTIDGLRQHQKTIHEGTRYYCLSCPETSSLYIANVYRHCREKHPGQSRTQLVRKRKIEQKTPVFLPMKRKKTDSL